MARKPPVGTEHFEDEDSTDTSEWTDAEDWERIENDGDAVTLDANRKRFEGLFIGRGVKHDVTRADGSIGDVTIYKFAEDASGESHFMWYSYELEQAFTDARTGEMARVEWLYKREIDNGARSVNHYKVWFKKVASK